MPIAHVTAGMVNEKFKSLEKTLDLVIMTRAIIFLAFLVVLLKDIIFR